MIRVVCTIPEIGLMLQIHARDVPSNATNLVVIVSVYVAHRSLLVGFVCGRYNFNTKSE